MLNMTEIEIPENQKTTPWVRSLVFLIQGQAKIIQTQAEQIARLKTTVEELRDEIRRLKNTPKRPKFRPSGKLNSSNNGNQNAHTRQAARATQDGLVKKAKEEIVVKPVHVPEGSRFKGYATYSVQRMWCTS